MKKITINLFEMCDDCDECGLSYANAVEIISNDFPDVNVTLGDSDCCRIIHAGLFDGVFHLFNHFNIIPKFSVETQSAINKIGVDNFLRNREDLDLRHFDLTKEETFFLLNPHLDLSEYNNNLKDMLIGIFKEKDILIEVNNEFPKFPN